jgi:hypothetical protein
MTKIVTSRYKIYRTLAYRGWSHAKKNVKYIKQISMGDILYVFARSRKKTKKCLKFLFSFFKKRSLRMTPYITFANLLKKWMPTLKKQYLYSHRHFKKKTQKRVRSAQHQIRINQPTTFYNKRNLFKKKRWAAPKFKNSNEYKMYLNKVRIFSLNQQLRQPNQKALLKQIQRSIFSRHMRRYLLSLTFKERQLFLTNSMHRNQILEKQKRLIQSFLIRVFSKKHEFFKNKKRRLNYAYVKKKKKRYPKKIQTSIQRSLFYITHQLRKYNILMRKLKGGLQLYFLRSDKDLFQQLLMRIDGIRNYYKKALLKLRILYFEKQKKLRLMRKLLPSIRVKYKSYTRKLKKSMYLFYKIKKINENRYRPYLFNEIYDDKIDTLKKKRISLFIKRLRRGKINKDRFLQQITYIINPQSKTRKKKVESLYAIKRRFNIFIKNLFGFSTTHQLQNYIHFVSRRALTFFDILLKLSMRSNLSICGSFFFLPFSNTLSLEFDGFKHLNFIKNGALKMNSQAFFSVGDHVTCTNPRLFNSIVLHSYIDNMFTYDFYDRSHYTLMKYLFRYYSVSIKKELLRFASRSMLRYQMTLQLLFIFICSLQCYQMASMYTLTNFRSSYTTYQTVLSCSNHFQDTSFNTIIYFFNRSIYDSVSLLFSYYDGHNKDSITLLKSNALLLKKQYKNKRKGLSNSFSIILPKKINAKKRKGVWKKKQNLSRFLQTRDTFFNTTIYLNDVKRSKRSYTTRTPFLGSLTFTLRKVRPRIFTRFPKVGNWKNPHYYNNKSYFFTKNKFKNSYEALRFNNSYRHEKQFWKQNKNDIKKETILKRYYTTIPFNKSWNSNNLKTSSAHLPKYPNNKKNQHKWDPSKTNKRFQKKPFFWKRKKRKIVKGFSNRIIHLKKQLRQKYYNNTTTHLLSSNQTKSRSLDLFMRRPEREFKYLLGRYSTLIFYPTNVFMFSQETIDFIFYKRRTLILNTILTSPFIQEMGDRMIYRTNKVQFLLRKYR